MCEAKRADGWNGYVYAGLKEDSAGEVTIFGKITNQPDKVRGYLYEIERMRNLIYNLKKSISGLAEIVAEMASK